MYGKGVNYGRKLAALLDAMNMVLQAAGLE
jgi:hypothetical protein